jgi:hypothetical protein
MKDGWVRKLHPSTAHAKNRSARYDCLEVEKDSRSGMPQLSSHCVQECGPKDRGKEFLTVSKAMISLNPVPTAGQG